MTRGLRIAITGDIDDGLEDLDSCLRPLCETLESIGIPMTIPIVAHAVENNPRKVVYLAEHRLMERPVALKVQFLIETGAALVPRTPRSWTASPAKF